MACSLPVDTISRVKEAANIWLENGDKVSLDSAVYSLLDLTKSGDVKVSHFATCSLGDLVARNGSYVDGFHLLSKCVEAFDFKQIQKKVSVCDDQNIWDLETGLWNAHLAGQLGRILLRYNKGRDGLEKLYIAEKFLQREYQPYVYKYDQKDVEIVKNAIDGFKGLILRTTFEYSKSEQYLLNGIKLALSERNKRQLNLSGSKKLRWWSREDVREMYINYGDLLARKSLNEEAYDTYVQGHKRGLFSHPAQRSVIEVKHPITGAQLTSRAIWQRGVSERVDEVIQILEEHSDVITREAKGLLSPSTATHISPSSDSFTNTVNWVSSIVGVGSGNSAGFAQANSLLLQSESSLFSAVWWRAKFRLGLPGVWSQFFMYEHGLRDHANCKLTPVTCGIVESLGAKLNTQGDAKLSLMAPGTQVHSHCGPTNGRLRIHLGLMLSPQDEMGIHVGNHIANQHVIESDDDFDIVDTPLSSHVDSLELMRWEEGKAFCFDDSFEHSVFHNGEHPRLILILDILHPDINQAIIEYHEEVNKDRQTFKYPLPELGPPVSVVKNNIVAYPDRAARLGLKPPPTNVKEHILQNEMFHAFLFIISLFVLLFFYWKLALLPQIQKLRNVMEKRRLTKLAKEENITKEQTKQKKEK